MQADTSPSLVLLDEDVVKQPEGEKLLELTAARDIPCILLISPGPETVEVPDRKNLIALNKPVRTSTLRHRIEILFGAAKATPSAKKTGPKLADEVALTVLLVEDNLVNQKVALRLLDRLGYKADVANNGVEGVEAAQAQSYDLVLMDVQMPEMDGFTASREIRRLLPDHDQPKIIALTANALQGDRELCIEAGMDDYLTKPVKLHDMEEVIRRQFSPIPEQAPTTPA
jgi:CheY-like chemotaxis protein